MIERERIGKQLKELRLSRGWTQAYVGDHVSLSRSAISNIEGGKRALTINTLKRFCELFKIDISYFGMETDNFSEVQDLMTRLETLFNSELDEPKKDELYLKIMRLYLDSKKDT